MRPLGIFETALKLDTVDSLFVGWFRSAHLQQISSSRAAPSFLAWENRFLRFFSRDFLQKGKTGATEGFHGLFSDFLLSLLWIISTLLWQFKDA